MTTNIDATLSSHSLTLSLPIPQQVLLDILTTAVEGGSTYWLMCERINRDRDLNVLAVVRPLDTEDGKPFDPSNFDPEFLYKREWDITPETVVCGIQQLFKHGVLPKRGDLREAVLKGLYDPQDLDVDAEGADLIVQLGLFGDVVYG